MSEFRSERARFKRAFSDVDESLSGFARPRYYQLVGRNGHGSVISRPRADGRAYGEAGERREAAQVLPALPTCELRRSADLRDVGDNLQFTN